VASTATIISSEGHLLTARHCLNKCLIQARVFKAVYEQNLVSYFVTDPTQLGQATCEVQWDGQPQTIVIESTSPGFVERFDEAGLSTLNPHLMRSLRAQGFTSQGDFVIARLNGAVNTPCVPMNWPGVGSNSRVFAVSDPSATERESFNSTGDRAYLTRGEVLSTIADNSCVREAQMSDDTIAALKVQFDEPTAFVTSLDSNFGSSGTAALNVDGAVVGVVANTYRHAEFTGQANDEPEKRFCWGSTKVLRSEQIRGFLTEQLIGRLSCPMSSSKTPGLQLAQIVQ
jgi:hypothetical protein